MKFWHSTNQEYAERLAFHRLLAHLESERGCGKTSIELDELLEYIRKTVGEETVYLNERFPDSKGAEP